MDGLRFTKTKASSTWQICKVIEIKKGELTAEHILDTAYVRSYPQCIADSKKYRAIKEIHVEFIAESVPEPIEDLLVRMNTSKLFVMKGTRQIPVKFVAHNVIGIIKSLKQKNLIPFHELNPLRQLYLDLTVENDA